MKDFCVPRAKLTLRRCQRWQLKKSSHVSHLLSSAPKMVILSTLDHWCILKQSKPYKGAQQSIMHQMLWNRLKMFDGDLRWTKKLTIPLTGILLQKETFSVQPMHSWICEREYDYDKQMYNKVQLCFYKTKNVCLMKQKKNVNWCVLKSFIASYRYRFIPF